MEKLINIFHYLSFIKYPILLLALYYCYKPLFTDNTNIIESLNTGLIFMGLGLGLDALKNYDKLNWLDRQVLYKPNRAKYYFILIGLMIAFMILMGLKGYFSTNDSNLKSLSIGILVLGIGFIGFLKTGIETTKNYMKRSNQIS